MAWCRHATNHCLSQCCTRSMSTYGVTRSQWVKIYIKQIINRTTRTPAFWDTPRGLMITHTSDSHKIPGQKKTKSKLQILKNCRKLKFCNFARNFTRDTPSEVAWSDVYIWNGSNQNWRRYRADTGCGTDGQTDRRTDRRTEWNQQTHTPNNFVVGVCVYNKGWICLYIPGKFVLRECVFHKEFLIYAKCRELIPRCCMKFIQTCPKFFPCFFGFFFFKITFDLLLTNTSRLNALKYTDQPIWFDFYWWSLAKQTTNSNMVWYLNMNKSTYSYPKILARICRQQCILFGGGGGGGVGVLSLGSFSQR